MAKEVGRERGQVGAVILAQRTIEAGWWQRHLRDKGAPGEATRISYRALGVETGVVPGGKTALAENALVCDCQEVNQISRTMTHADMCEQLVMGWKTNTAHLTICFFNWASEQCGLVRDICLRGVKVSETQG